MPQAERFALTVALGEGVADLRPEQLDADLHGQAQRAFIDTVGVMHAGAAEPSPRALASAIAASGGFELRPFAVAELLGTAAHALDHDDVAFGGHPSAVLVPALLAAARLADRCDGLDLLTAYVAGYECWGEVARREPTKHHARGLHPTGLLGPLGAAAAVSSLLRLDAARTARALGLAASSCAGLVVNFGSMAKPFHAGRAAMSGFEAAWLAAHGMSASTQALEAPKGFLEAYSPSGRPDTVSPLVSLGRPAFLLSDHPPSIKRYPVCYAAHRCIDAAVQLHEEAKGRWQVGDIASVVASLSERNSAILRFRHPEHVNEARFSLEYVLATALAAGHVGLRDLTEQALREPQRLALVRRVERRIEPEPDPVMEGFALADRVDLELADGRRFEGTPVHRPLGHEDRPLTNDALQAKFDDCLQHAGFDEHDRQGCRDALGALPRGGDCRAWVDATVMRVIGRCRG